MDLWGRITKVEGNEITFSAENPEELRNLSLITQEEKPEAVVRLSDNRFISDVQRKKAYAIMRDISTWSGYDPMEIKSIMKFYFEEEYGVEGFSFARSSMTEARYFINMLLEYCLEYDVPLKRPILSLTDDLRSSMYLCIRYRKCALCGKHADIHHVDAVGLEMRHLTDHREKRLIALCRIHHQEAENMGWPSFSELYHVIGLKLKRQTLHDLGIMTYERMAEIDRRKERDDKSSGAGGAPN